MAVIFKGFLTFPARGKGSQQRSALCADSHLNSDARAYIESRAKRVEKSYGKDFAAVDRKCLGI
jgi:hypothetical protein